jgi:hypothetical protein
MLQEAGYFRDQDDYPTRSSVTPILPPLGENGYCSRGVTGLKAEEEALLSKLWANLAI